MIEYYSPQQVAYFVVKEDLNIKSIIELVQEIFRKEYSFIDFKYQKNEKLFYEETLMYINFLTFKEEFDNETKKDKQNDYLEKYKHFNQIQPNFFLITRLMLLYTKKYRRIKLRTLLKIYGYKRRKINIISKIHDTLIFYHLTTYHKNDQKDISEFELDEWITIKIF